MKHKKLIFESAIKGVHMILFTGVDIHLSRSGSWYPKQVGQSGIVGDEMKYNYDIYQPTIGLIKVCCSFQNALHLFGLARNVTLILSLDAIFARLLLSKAYQVFREFKTCTSFPNFASRKIRFFTNFSCNLWTDFSQLNDSVYYDYF